MAKKVEKELSEFITGFLEGVGRPKTRLSSLLEEWNSEETQTALKNLLLVCTTPRPKTAYFLFSADKKDEIRRENPPNLTQRIRANWLILSDEEKEPWVEKAKEEKEKYKGLIGEIPKKKRKKSAPEPKPKTKEEEDVDKLLEKSFRSTSTPRSSGNPMFSFIESEKKKLSEKHPDWDTRKLVATLKEKWEKMDPALRKLLG
jgi:hypothetical protein